MRITPVNMAYNRQNLKSNNQYNKQQNVSFGQVESKETDEFTRTKIIEGNRNHEGFYDYLVDSPHVMIKKRKDIVYITAIRKEINKLEHKDYVYQTLDIYRNYCAPNGIKEARKAGILDTEPDYIMSLTCKADVIEAADLIMDAVQGPQPPEPEEPGEPEEDRFQWQKDQNLFMNL